MMDIHIYITKPALTSIPQVKIDIDGLDEQDVSEVMRHITVAVSTLLDVLSNSNPSRMAPQTAIGVKTPIEEEEQA